MWNVCLNSLWSTQYACKLNAFNIPYMYIVNDLSLTRAVSRIGDGHEIWQLFYNEVLGKILWGNPKKKLICIEILQEIYTSIDFVLRGYGSGS